MKKHFRPITELGDFIFRRQHPLGQFVVDFYCPAYRLVIEIDGEIHLDQEEYDLIRTEQIKALGCQCFVQAQGRI